MKLNNLRVLKKFSLLTILSLISTLILAVTPANAASEVSACSFSADGGSSVSYLDVSLNGTASVSIGAQVSPDTTAKVIYSLGVVPKTDKTAIFTFTSSGERDPAAIDPSYLGAYAWNASNVPTLLTSNDSTNYQQWDMNWYFNWYQFDPSQYFWVTRFYNATTRNVMCQITVDYTPTPPAVNYGHSDKTASPADRNRDYFSTDPSGQKPKKQVNESSGE